MDSPCRSRRVSAHDSSSLLLCHRRTATGIILRLLRMSIRRFRFPRAQPSTTIDEIEREFQRKKKRELEQARMAGSASAEAPAQRRTGDKVGRNDPCPCGSGKKYKKCHGTNEA